MASKPVICNSCGKPCVGTDGDPEKGEYGLIKATLFGGYFSRKPIEDETRYRFSLCEACLARMFKRFKIPPEEVCLLDASEMLKAGMCPACHRESGYINLLWEPVLLDDLCRAGIIQKKHLHAANKQMRRIHGSQHMRELRAAILPKKVKAK